MPRPVRPKIAYVSAQLPSYLAAEHRVVERSEQALDRLALALDFERVGEWPCVTSRAGAEVVAREAEELGVDMVLLQCSSFAMGDVVAPFGDGRYRLGLWAIEEPRREGPIALNGFVAMHLHAGVLTSAAVGAPRPYKWFFGLDDHPWLRDRLAVTVAALRGIRALREARIASIGGVAPSFWSLAVDERALRARLGVQIDVHDLGDVIVRARSVAADEVDRVVDDLRRAVRSVGAPDDDMRLGAATYVALREVALEGGYDALAVSDWPLFQETLGIHPGMAFSWLDEHDGIPVASEGDVMGGLSMRFAGALATGPAMLLDMNDVDLAADAIIMWHCGGSPLGFADARGATWDVHSTLGRKQPGAVPRGAVADLRFRHGPVSLLRLRSDGAELFALDAEVVAHPTAGFDGSRGWVSAFRDADGPRSAADVVSTVLSLGVEHHIVLSDGAVAPAAREAAAWLGMRLTPTVPYRDELVASAGGAR
ncbi:L-fucose isomerase-like protein [soil metagenome]